MTSAPFLRLAPCLLVCLSLASGQAPPKPDWAYTPKPGLANVLIIGDSISIGYTLAVRSLLEGRANVYRPMRPDGKAAANCLSTQAGLQDLDKWLGDAKWDVIHFNWGLHDLCYRNPEAKTQGNRDKVNGKIQVPLPEYTANMEKLVAALKKTGARLIWASTTKVPDGEEGRFTGDDLRYNRAAREIMARNRIPTDDLYALTASMPRELSLGPGNVHFKPEGYERLAKQVAAAIEQALARK
jgi:lysophospholipase L1-like esterase